MEKIRAENITKIFGDHPERALQLLAQGANREEIFNQTGQAVGLANVSFDVQEGEILVVMGLSGSGKSTLIRCLNRLIEPTQGKLLIDGIDILKLSQTALLELRRHKFGMVFQHFALFPHRSVLNNAAYGLEIQNIPTEQRQDKARQALKLVGLEGWEEAMPRQLSGGMQQRVGLARALAVEPDILLMDEAFSALDPLIRRDMQDELVALQQRVKKTILFITHDLDEALRIGDRIILMKDGRVVQIGTPTDILTAPADEYVKRFVENVDKSKILTAQSVLSPLQSVAHPQDTPHNLLNKMQEHQLTSLFVVTPDNYLQGLVKIDAVRKAIENNELSTKIELEIRQVAPSEPLSNLIAILVEQPLSPIAVVNKEGQLLGVVMENNILTALAHRSHT